MKRFFVVGAGAGALVFSFWLFWMDGARNLTLRSNETGRVNVVKLKRELDSIKVMQGASKITDTVFDRGGSLGVARNYEVSSSINEIVEYYRINLYEKGWALSKDRLIGQRERSVMFCKGRISFTISIVSYEFSQNVYTGVVWSRFLASSTYCDQS